MTATNNAPNEPQAANAVSVDSTDWEAALVFRWREASAHHYKVASSRERSYSEPLYEDGLAEAFGRCADILANEIAANEKAHVPLADSGRDAERKP